MESNQKLELIDRAIQKLLAENRSKGVSPDNDQLLLSKLLSELESSKSKELDEQINSEADLKNEEETEIGAEEIVKEINQVKKQNLITHCLLSALIVLTVAWQVSEVSLILKLKHGFSHPFKYLGGTLLGMFRVSGVHEQDADKPLTHSPTPSPPPPESSHLHMPELPRLGMNNESHNGEK